MGDRDDCPADRLSAGEDTFDYSCAVGSQSVYELDSVPGVRKTDAGAPSKRLKGRKPVGKAASAPSLHDGAIIGSSPQAAALREKIDLYALDDAPVMVTGETGVGKELVARRLHMQSARKHKRFLPLNLGAVPESLAAAQLFGHDKGAFTGAVGARDGAFAAADGGVLFLDEIGDMPLALQAHLLRVLEDSVVVRLGGFSERRVNVRFVSATNVDLQASVLADKFRRDLFYRINVLTIHAPPLRERGDDVVEIAEAMIAAHAAERNLRIALTPAAADKLKTHGFPGNVRELRNVIARALVHARGGKIVAEHIVFDEVCSAETCGAVNIPKAKELVGRYLMMKALRHAGGNVTKAAELAGYSRGTLHALKKQLEGTEFAAAYQAAGSEIKALFRDC